MMSIFLGSHQNNFGHRKVNKGQKCNNIFCWYYLLYTAVLMLPIQSCSSETQFVNSLDVSQVFSIPSLAQGLVLGAEVNWLSQLLSQLLFTYSSAHSLKIQPKLSKISPHIEFGIQLLGVGWLWYLFILHVNFSLSEFSLKHFFEI